jgi:hypothetical protein
MMTRRKTEASKLLSAEQVAAALIMHRFEIVWA